MSPLWRFNVLGHLMNLPMSIIGLLLFSLVYRAHSWRWSDGCIECIGGDRIWGKPGCQTLGGVLCYADETQRKRPDLRVHERVHVVQGMFGSVLYSLTYGLTFLWFYLRHPSMGWRVAYYQIPWEVQAYRIGDKAKGWGA
jgi:hypothetical protein